jgi:hypothetical protein
VDGANFAARSDNQRSLPHMRGSADKHAGIV